MKSVRDFSWNPVSLQVELIAESVLLPQSQYFSMTAGDQRVLEEDMSVALGLWYVLLKGSLVGGGRSSQYYFFFFLKKEDNP